MRRYEFSEAADADFDAIVGRISVDDPITAQAVAKRIKSSIEAVCGFPYIGKETARKGVFVFGGRKKTPFRITYTFTDSTVFVTRIFRASREHIQF